MKDILNSFLIEFEGTLRKKKKQLRNNERGFWVKFYFSLSEIHSRTKFIPTFWA
jgi:hypothetical protein